MESAQLLQYLKTILDEEVTIEAFQESGVFGRANAS